MAKATMTITKSLKVVKTLKDFYLLRGCELISFIGAGISPSHSLTNPPKIGFTLSFGLFLYFTPKASQIDIKSP